MPLMRYLAPLVLLALIGCAASRAPEEKRQLDAAIASTGETHLIAEGEPGVLRSSRAHRDGHDLSLPLADAPPLTLSDSKSCAPREQGQDNPDCSLYYLLADLPQRHLYLVAQAFYEDTDYLLVDDRSGTKTKIAAPPVFAPDNVHFLLCIPGGGASEYPNALEIWKRDGDGAVQEWAYSWKDAYADDPALKNPFAARVTSWDHTGRVELAFRDESDWFDTATRKIIPARNWTGTLTRDETGWHLRSQLPQ